MRASRRMAASNRNRLLPISAIFMPKSGRHDFGCRASILRDAVLRTAPSTKVKTKFPPGSTMENRLSSAVVGPAGGQLRMRSIRVVNETRAMRSGDK